LEEKRLKSKAAIVTGASYGIGEGIAYSLASKGYDLLITHLNEEEQASQVSDSIYNQYNRRCVVMNGDLSDSQTPALFWKKAVEEFGQIDVLVNNAATHTYKKLADMSLEETMRIIHVNYLGAVLMSQLAAELMSEGGSIVHITSTRAHRAYPVDSIYGSMKAALTRAAETMALEFAPLGIRVNCVAPGAIAREANTEFGNKLGKKIPLGRMGTPADIGNAVAWLCSDEADYITGITLRVDGGLILPGMPEDIRPEAGYGWGFMQQ
jgi:NAD(P)-dependent dehydrogenase (short-subunit alcohol dehydrogenase family)